MNRSYDLGVMNVVSRYFAASKNIGRLFVLTHCVSEYPCPYEIVNLGLMKKYETAFEVPVGLSDHSRGIYTALGATALGAACLEKHFTLDKLGGGPDNVVSIEPFELGELVRGADAIFKALGSERRIFKEEEQIVAWARESVVAERSITRGTTIAAEMVWVKRPSPGPGVVPAKDLNKVIGRRARADIPKDTQVR